MKVIDEGLPGRTEDEERALKVFVRRRESADWKLRQELHGPLPATDRGRSGRQERITAFQAALDEATAALLKCLGELADERLKLLPDDATDIDHGGGGGGDDGRYPVVCTSGGQRVSLGACSTLGPAEDRKQWFLAAANRRRG